MAIPTLGLKQDECDRHRKARGHWVWCWWTWGDVVRSVTL